MWGRRKLGVVIACADWRLHRRPLEFTARLNRMLRVAAVDLLALPGPDGLLREERRRDWETIQDWTKLLVSVHDARALAVVAHQKCAGHPVSDEAHERDVVETAKALKAAIGFDGPASAIIAVRHSDAKWGLDLIECC